MFACMECGKKFRTVGAAQRASWNGCPKCGGVDIDLDTSAPPDRRPTVDIGSFPEPTRDTAHPEGL